MRTRSMGRTGERPRAGRVPWACPGAGGADCGGGTTANRSAARPLEPAERWGFLSGDAVQRGRLLLAGFLVAAVSSTAVAEPPDLRLLNAVREIDHVTLRALLQEGVDVDAAQPDGATALHWAAYLDDIEAARLLIEAGASADPANELGATPLYLACENGNPALVRALLEAGAAPDAALPSGETALMTAARTGSAGAVAALLAHGADVHAREAMEAQTALMWAVSQRHPGVVEVLLDAGAEVQARSRVRPVVVAHSPRTGAPGAVTVVDEGGYTPLLFAARSGDLASARMLLAAGADPNDTAPAGTSALVVATHSGHGALAAVLLRAGANANASGAGYTPLHAAVLRGDESLVRALLAHGADPDVPLERGTRYARQGKLFSLDTAWTGATPFFLAAKFGEGGIMRRLAEAGANPHAALHGGVTPLMAAAGMLTRGFGRAGKDRRGREMDSAQMEVALTQDPDLRPVMGSGLEAVEVAVELGADVNAADANGDTALHLAAFHGFESVVRFLVSRGARLDAENRRGETPLERALSPRAPARLTRSLTDYSDTSTADLLLALAATR